MLQDKQNLGKYCRSWELNESHDAEIITLQGNQPSSFCIYINITFYFLMTLPQLVKECRANSTTAQKYLFGQYAASMFLLCRRYIKTDAVAEECMMNGFFHFFKSLHSFKYQNDAATIGWLKRIMINECLQQLRIHNSFVLVTEDEAVEVSIEEDAVSRLTAEEIFKVITQLPTGYRTVFNLYSVEGFSHREIAAALGISEGTSKSQLSKAKQLLQKLLININADNDARKAK